MAENEPEAAPQPSSRRRGLTPEQRRFLGTPRAQDEAEQSERAAEPEEERRPADIEPTATASPAQRRRQTPPPAEASTGAQAAAEAPDAAAVPLLRPNESLVRRFELGHALLIIGVVLALVLAFYVGMRFQYLKYLIFSRNTQAPRLEGSFAGKFPGLTADELVVQGLAAQRAGDYQGAVEKLLVAKHRNLGYRGILFHVGVMAYEKADFDTAERILERSVAFGENLDAAQYYRGLIAVRRKELAAATRFFTAAVETAPFVSDYHYYLAEAVRLDHRPQSAIPHYERAALLARNEQDATVCRFKTRMARLEAADTNAVARELEERERAGVLPVDWLMVASAIQIRQGQLGEGLRYLTKAREGSDPGLFASCVTDMFFRNACQVHPALKEVCQLDFDPAVVLP